MSDFFFFFLLPQRIRKLHLNILKQTQKSGKTLFIYKAGELYTKWGKGRVSRDPEQVGEKTNSTLAPRSFGCTGSTPVLRYTPRKLVTLLGSHSRSGIQENSGTVFGEIYIQTDGIITTVDLVTSYLLTEKHKRLL